MAHPFGAVAHFVGWGLLAFGVVCLPAGCGPGRGHVSGKVLLADGKPLPGGTITFYPQQGARVAPVVATIGEDGSYDARNVPVGPANIAVSNTALDPKVEDSLVPSGKQAPAVEKMPPQMRAKIPTMGPPKEATAGKDVPSGGKPKPPGTYVPIRSQYANPDTSGITCDVQRGDQTFDVKGILSESRKR